jgi:hypothetical protein
MRVDHVIWATADLAATAERLATEHGLQVAGGGRHEGLGTHNRILPLGGGYLEVLAVHDPDEAARSTLGQAIAGAAEGLLGWAVAVDDVAANAERLGLPVTTIARQGLTARLAGVEEAMAGSGLPFFIERDPGVADPGSEGAGGGIAWLEVAADPDRLDAWLGGAALPLRLTDDRPHGPRAVGLGSGAVIR